MNLKRTFEKGSPGKGDFAILAWRILGSALAAAIVFAIVASIPELTRYLKLKNM